VWGLEHQPKRDGKGEISLKARHDKVGARNDKRGGLRMTTHPPWWLALVGGVSGFFPR